MKKTLFSPGAVGFTAAVFLLTTGCKQGEKPSDRNQPAAKTVAGKATEKPAIVSAEKNSFNEVTSKLDAGGDFYLYLGTEQWLNGVSGKVGEVRDFVLGLPNVKTEDHDKVEKAFGVVEDLVKESGLEQVSGVGASSIAREPGFYYNKIVLHHYKDAKGGFLWSLFGDSPHTLDGLDLLPANTALANFSDLDIRLLWNVATNEVERLNIPEASQSLAQFPAMFAKQSGMTLDELLNSLGGEYGVVLTLDPAKQISIPAGMTPVQIPEPALMIVAKVKNDALFNRIDASFKGNQQVIRVDKDGLKMRTMPVPLPLPIQLRPTVARSGDYLFIASTDSLIQEALDVKSGKRPGWKASDEYKKLSQGLPTKGNNFVFISEKFGQTVADVQTQALSNKGAMNQSQVEGLRKLFGAGQMNYSFGVGANTDEGWVFYSNGNQSMNRVALVPAVAVGGFLAAIAVPNFVKARETAQNNGCINNLRQIDAAKEQWAIEHNRKTGDTPTASELFGQGKYVKKKPVCPAGGTYTIGPVGTPPTCSHPGHVLPN